MLFIKKKLYRRNRKLIRILKKRHKTDDDGKVNCYKVLLIISLLLRKF